VLQHLDAMRHKNAHEKPFFLWTCLQTFLPLASSKNHRNRMRQHLLVFLLFFVVVHLFYYPTWDAGFVTDFTGLAWRIETHHFWDFLNSFDFPSLQPVLNFFLVIFYKVFGTNGLPWYLIFTSLHIINGFLLFQLNTKLLQHFDVPNAKMVGFAAAILFLLSPYASEVVTWRVCFNFSLVSLLILLILWNTVRWLETKEIKYRNRSLLLLLPALFTFELSLITSLLTSSLLLLWTFHFNEKILLQKRLLQATLPQFVMLGGYFLLHKIVLGVWIGHYGAAVHLRFIPKEMLANGFKYFAKYLFFTRYWAHPAKEAFFNGIDKNVWILTTLAAALIMVYFIFFKRLSPPLRLVGWYLLGFGFSLVLILNLYFTYLLHIENDRYGYLPSMFFFTFLLILISLLPRWWNVGFFSFYLIISLFLLHKTTRIWSDATKVYYSLLNDFRWYERDTVYILNLPDNLNGCLLFRDYSGEDLGFADALRYIRRKPYNGKLYEVSQYNMTTIGDGVTAQIDSTGQVIATFNQWGNWWWRRGIGAIGYEKDNFKAAFEGQSCKLQLKDKPKNAAFIYQIGEKWEELIK